MTVSETRIRASAPGKLLLFGEYAVLAGGTALVMAVDRRAVVTIDPLDSEDLHVVAPQLGLTGNGLQFDVEVPNRVLGMTGRLLAHRLDARHIAAAGLRITIDTSALFDDGTEGPVKLGLGSSAAVAAALEFAIGAMEGQAQAGLDDLLPAYRDAIGGPVSGADLAASVHGGLVRVQSAGEGLRTEILDWPPGLRALPIWVRSPASTPKFAAAFGDWRTRHPDRCAAWLRTANELTRQAQETATATAWMACAEGWVDALGELQAALDVDILTDAHRALIRAGRHCGAAYKTCGAGGGDFGIALSDDPDALEALGERALALGGRPVELELEKSGARVESEREPARQ